MKLPEKKYHFTEPIATLDLAKLGLEPIAPELLKPPAPVEPNRVTELLPEATAAQILSVPRDPNRGIARHDSVVKPDVKLLAEDLK